MLGHPGQLFILYTTAQPFARHRELSFMLPLLPNLPHFGTSQHPARPAWEGSGPGMVDVLNVSGGRMCLGEAVACDRTFFAFVLRCTYNPNCILD